MVLLLATGSGLVYFLPQSCALPQSSSRLQLAEVVSSYPHDPKGFCQGLIFQDGNLYEGTGEYGTSAIRLVDLSTGQVQKAYSVPPEFFGEGITRLDGQIYQLTWKEKKAFVYEETDYSFEKVAEFDYPFEGWGITHDGSQLITSDGTSTVRFLNPKTFEVIREVRVLDGNIPVKNLNELEYIKGEIYANVWTRDWIVRISPETGKVLGWIDLGQLRKEIGYSPLVGVLNGIAYDKESDRLFATGKNWPKLFEIRLVEKDPL